MSRPDPIGSEVRKARRDRRIGVSPACVFCGFQEPSALVRVQRSLLEQHHPFTVAHVPGATVPLCRNCHALETERMRDAGIPLTGEHLSTLEVIEAVLRAHAIFLHADADASEGFAEELRRLINDLDQTFPGWRELERVR